MTHPLLPEKWLKMSHKKTTTAMFLKCNKMRRKKDLGLSLIQIFTQSWRSLSESKFLGNDLDRDLNLKCIYGAQSLSNSDLKTKVRSKFSSWYFLIQRPKKNHSSVIFQDIFRFINQPQTVYQSNHHNKCLQCMFLQTAGMLNRYKSICGNLTFLSVQFSVFSFTLWHHCAHGLRLDTKPFA